MRLCTRLDSPEIIPQHCRVPANNAKSTRFHLASPTRSTLALNTCNPGFRSAEPYAGTISQPHTSDGLGVCANVSQSRAIWPYVGAPFHSFSIVQGQSGQVAADFCASPARTPFAYPIRQPSSVVAIPYAVIGIGASPPVHEHAPLHGPAPRGSAPNRAASVPRHPPGQSDRPRGNCTRIGPTPSSSIATRCKKRSGGSRYFSASASSQGRTEQRGRGLTGVVECTAHAVYETQCVPSHSIYC